jgi:protein phosphatase
VEAAAIARVLRETGDPDQAAAELIALAIDGGGPDNITCIVADVVDPDPAATVPGKAP